MTTIGAATEQQQGGRADTKNYEPSRLGEAGATLYFPLSGLTPLPGVDLGQIKLTDRLGPCFHFWYFLVDSPRGHHL